MAVLLETSRGDIVIDLFVDDCPVTCKNFLKLCKAKYYNNCIFHNVQRNFLVQTGDPTATGKGGSSIYGLMYGDQARFFEDEKRPHLKHKAKGMVGMASPAPNLNASQFYITTGEDLQSLDEKHTIFGKVGEGLDVLDKIDEAFVDEAGRPLQNIRIRHTIILDDPFDDPGELEALIPPESPEPQFEQGDRLEDDWAPQEDTRDIEEIEEEARKADAHNRAVVLEMIGDLPEADAKPPSNALFICKLNPVTTEEDLDIIFSRFGTVTDCSIIRDYKTGDSLCYGFIGFDNDASCEEAYFKMNNVLIDDRRIKVDFSQSVAHLWKQFKKGGKRGDAAMMRDAEAHQRDPNAARDRLGSSQGRLELKGGGGYAGVMGMGGSVGLRGPAAGRGGPGQGQQHRGLLLDDDDGGGGGGNTGHHQQQASGRGGREQRQEGPGVRGPPPSSSGRDRDGDRGRGHDRDGDRHRSDKRGGDYERRRDDDDRRQHGSYGQEDRGMHRDRDRGGGAGQVNSGGGGDRRDRDREREAPAKRSRSRSRSRDRGGHGSRRGDDRSDRHGRDHTGHRDDKSRRDKDDDRHRDRHKSSKRHRSRSR